VCAREPKQERLEGIIGGLEENVGNAARRLHAERIAVASDVFDRDPAIFSGDANADRTPFGRQLLEPHLGVGARAACRDFGAAQVAQAAQQIVQLVASAGLAIRQRLQLELQLRHGRRVQQLAQLFLAQ